MDMTPSPPFVHRRWTNFFEEKIDLLDLKEGMG